MNKREVAMRIARYSETLDKLNWISRWNAMVEKTDAPMLHDRDALFPFLDDKLGPDPITYLEFGVQRGNSMRKWVGLNQHPDSTFHGFDTFEGLPEDWNARWPKGSFSTNGVTPDIDDPRGSSTRASSRTPCGRSSPNRASSGPGWSSTWTPTCTRRRSTCCASSIV